MTTDKFASAIKALESGPGTSVPVPGNGSSSPSTASEAKTAPITPTETPVAAETKPEAPKEAASKHFAAIAKRERDLVRKQREIDEREKALQSREVVPSAAEVRKKYATNPIKALEELGVTYEQLTDFVLNGQEPTPELQNKAVTQQIEELRAEMRAKEEKAEADAKKAAEAEHAKAVSDFQKEVNAFLLTNNEKYELIGLHDYQPVVTAVIEQHYQTTKKAGKPRIMSIEEAATLVEQNLEANTERLLKANKIQAKIAPKNAEKASTASSDEPQFQTSTPKTLTNNLSSSASKPAAQTESERIKRALAALG